MAAVLAVGFIFCATNPVMAKNIPVVGGLFEILQDNVSFFGDFQIMQQPWNPLMEQRQMAVKQMGTRQVMPLVRMLTLKQQMADNHTFEVYANSQAVYITMQFKSDKPFPETSTRAESGT